jgi:hypothetical protein
LQAAPEHAKRRSIPAVQESLLSSGDESEIETETGSEDNSPAGQDEAPSTSETALPTDTTIVEQIGKGSSEGMAVQEELERVRQELSSRNREFDILRWELGAAAIMEASLREQMGTTERKAAEEGRRDEEEIRCAKRATKEALEAGKAASVAVGRAEEITREARQQQARAEAETAKLRQELARTREELLHARHEVVALREENEVLLAEDSSYHFQSSSRNDLQEAQRHMLQQNLQQLVPRQSETSET